MDQLLKFLELVIICRLDYEFGKTAQLNKPQTRINFDPSDGLGKFVQKWDIKNQDLVLLALAMVPFLNPGFFRKLIYRYIPEGNDFPEFGGIKSKHHRGIIPTGETVLYLLAGTDALTRQRYFSLFRTSKLFQKGVLKLGDTEQEEPLYAAPLLLGEEYAELLLEGNISKPKLSPRFPAQLIETEMDWKDLVLPEKTLQQIRDIKHWLMYNDTLMNSWGLKGKIKPGYRVMFFGPPGTGKTLSAGLLGKYTNRDVYRIDLSLVVSKYIGETEKNLSGLFDKASGKDWILFFDEADAIFGKRTSVRDAHDKYANQEVSYLLQRIEMHPGLVILASNFKSNIDTAFTRRFQSIIEFDTPGPSERFRLWKNNLPTDVPLDKDINLDEVARKYPLTGANIVNVVQQVGLKTLAAKEKVILRECLEQCIKSEFYKEGKLH